MGLNSIGGSDDLLQKVPEKFRLSLSEAESEVRLYLAGEGISYKHLGKIEQVYDPKNSEYIMLQFSYFDSNGELKNGETKVKNTIYIEKFKINSSSLDDKNADYRANIATLREEEQALAGKLEDAIKGGGEFDLTDFYIKKYIEQKPPIEPKYIDTGVPSYKQKPEEPNLFISKIFKENIDNPKGQ